MFYMSMYNIDISKQTCLITFELHAERMVVELQAEGCQASDHILRRFENMKPQDIFKETNRQFISTLVLTEQGIFCQQIISS